MGWVTVDKSYWKRCWYSNGIHNAEHIGGSEDAWVFMAVNLWDQKSVQNNHMHTLVATKSGGGMMHHAPSHK